MWKIGDKGSMMRASLPVSVEMNHTLVSRLSYEFLLQWLVAV